MGEGNFNSYIDGNLQSKNVFELSNQVKVVHMNGLVLHPCLNSLGLFEINELVEQFSTLIYSTDEEKNKLANSILFAWESNDMSKPGTDKFLLEASNAIKSSHSLILTGYSLPLYNRLFDKLLLNVETLDQSHIYIRDPRADEIKLLLESDFNLKASEDTLTEEELCPDAIIASSNCDSFFVPSSIYNG